MNLKDTEYQSRQLAWQVFNFQILYWREILFEIILSFILVFIFTHFCFLLFRCNWRWREVGIHILLLLKFKMCICTINLLKCSVNDFIIFFRIIISISIYIFWNLDLLFSVLRIQLFLFIFDSRLDNIRLVYIRCHRRFWLTCKQWWNFLLLRGCLRHNLGVCASKK